MKGESSRYINNHNLTDAQFDWADDYYAASVCQSNIELVRNYLKKQESHHEKRTFTEECEEFMTRYGFVRILG